MKLHVGNLSYQTNDDSLRQAFAAIGTVNSANVITDRETGRSRGFGFVEMSNDDEARKAITQLNETTLDGRNISVSEARPRAPRDDRGGSRGGYNSRW